MGFLHFLWMIFVIYVFVMFIVIFVNVVIDLFRSDDLSGWAKAGWLILLIVLPFLGVLIYILARHNSMQARAVRSRMADLDRMRAAGAITPVAEIEQAQHLLEAGAISAEEFAEIKRRALA